MFVWSFLRWLGRVALWVVFLPLGLWRSVRHGQRKRDRRQADELAAAIERKVDRGQS